MLFTDMLPFFVPFIVGLLLYLKTGCKFRSTTAAVISGIVFNVYLHDMKALWLTIAAIPVLWFLFLIFGKNPE